MRRPPPSPKAANSTPLRAVSLCTILQNCAPPQTRAPGASLTLVAHNRPFANL